MNIKVRLDTMLQESTTTGLGQRSRLVLYLLAETDYATLWLADLMDMLNWENPITGSLQ